MARARQKRWKPHSPLLAQHAALSSVTFHATFASTAACWPATQRLTTVPLLAAHGTVQTDRNGWGPLEYSYDTYQTGDAPGDYAYDILQLGRDQKDFELVL